MTASENLLWWQTGVVYQIYPRSFMDTNGDGVGDLRGITKKIPYLSDTLGVDAIWISPFYPSPMADFGYDVADYTNVDPIFGTLADFEALVSEAHAHQVRVIIDFVPNHTSDQHPWFVDSRGSKSSPKRDWYIWRDPKADGSPPNNWLSVFGGPAWTLDPHTGQYYLHSFLTQQPDLNWRNPAVKNAMFDALRFWMQRGVDGFRVDVAHFLMKDPDLRDNPPAVRGGLHKQMGDYDSLQHIHDVGHPDNHALYREFRGVLNEFESISPRMSVGEIHIFDWDQWATYYGDNDELHMPFNFAFIGAPWRADVVRDVVTNVERVLTRGQQPNYVFGNHDEHRVASHHNPAIARAVMMTLLTLRGTPTIYYGDEIGMLDGEIPPDAEQDPWGKRVPGLGLGRDPERTPMQWDSSPHAGFAPANAETWLPVASNYHMLNVAAQLNDPHAMLSLTRALLRLRRASPALHGGSHRTITDGTPEDCFVYVRQSGDEQMLVAINFADAARTIHLPTLKDAQIVISTQLDRQEKLTGTLVLRPYEGCVLKV